MVRVCDWISPWDRVASREVGKTLICVSNMSTVVVAVRLLMVLLAVTVAVYVPTAG